MISFYGGPNGIQGKQGIQGEKGNSFTITNLEIGDNYSFTEEDKVKYNSDLGTWLGVYSTNTNFNIMQYQTKKKEVQSFLLGTLSQPLWYKIQNDTLVVSDKNIYLTRDSSNNLVEGQLDFSIDNNRLKISTKIDGIEYKYESPIPYSLDNVNGYLTTNEIKQDQIGDIKLKALPAGEFLIIGNEWVQLPYNFNQLGEEDYPLFQEKYSNSNNVDINKGTQLILDVTTPRYYSSHYGITLNQQDNLLFVEIERGSTSDRYKRYKINLNTWEKTDEGFSKYKIDEWKWQANPSGLVSSVTGKFYPFNFYTNSGIATIYAYSNDSFVYRYSSNSRFEIGIYNKDKQFPVYTTNTDINYSYNSNKYIFLDNYIFDKTKNILKPITININNFISSNKNFFEYNNRVYLIVNTLDVYVFNEIAQTFDKIKSVTQTFPITSTIIQNKIIAINNGTEITLLDIDYYLDSNFSKSEYLDKIKLHEATYSNNPSKELDQYYYSEGNGIIFQYDSINDISIYKLKDQLPITHSFTIPKVSNAEYEYLKIK